MTPASVNGPGATGPGLLTRSRSKIGCGCHSRQVQTTEAVWGVNDQEYGSVLQPQGSCDQGWERNWTISTEVICPQRSSALSPPDYHQVMEANFQIKLLPPAPCSCSSLPPLFPPLPQIQVQGPRGSRCGEVVRSVDCGLDLALPLCTPHAGQWR